MKCAISNNLSKYFAFLSHYTAEMELNYSTCEKKQEFLLSLKMARDGRARDKQTENSIILLQALVRGWLVRKRYRKIILKQFDDTIGEDGSKKLEPALNIFRVMRKFFSIWRKDEDRMRFVNLCRFVTKSLDEENVSLSYVGVFLLKEHSLAWIAQLKEFLTKCNLYLKCVSTDTYTSPADLQSTMIILLHAIVSLTSTNTWRILNVNPLPENLRLLKPGLNQLCKNTVGNLMKENFYCTLKEILRRVFTPAFGMPKISFTNTCLMAVMILASRPLLYSDFVDHVASKFVQNILTIPALVHHVRTISPQFFSTFDEEQLLSHVIAFLNHHRCQSDASPKNSDSFVELINRNESNELLCFVGNFIELVDVYLDYVAKKNLNLSFMNAVSFLLVQCKRYVLAHRSSNLTQWHPILGWFSQVSYDASLHDSLPLIKKQLCLLWTKPFISLLLETPLQAYVKEMSNDSSTDSECSGIKSAAKNTGLGKKALDLLADATNVNSRWIRRQPRMSSEMKCLLQDVQHRLRIACAMYHTVVETFVQLRLDVLTGLCYQSDVLHLFWRYLLVQNDGLKFLHRYVSSSVKFKELNGDVNCQVLLIFSECMIHYITILDDVEMYEQQLVFRLADFIQLSAFLNYFLYKGIVNEVFSKECTDELTDQLFNNLHRLLMVLYIRNCRRTYTNSPSHWIIKEIKSNSFFIDLERDNKRAFFLKEKMPHVISYPERVHLLKKNIHLEKCRLKEQLSQQSDRHSAATGSSNFSVPVRLIKIRRNHIVEDAFHCLQRMSSTEMKHAFRVKFLNKEGLEEAGVDQAGIFKEFIVDLVKKLFDPSLNLFRRTSNGHVYPSPMSNVSETNHLDLIEFSGRMLAKAIYEGLILDVRLASFFLSQILGQTQSTFYSYLDDLPSLDDELYRSLMYVKRYDSDVSDLCLTFSTTEECFGTVLTRDLIPGGRVINVTNFNKIIYIHLMAHFRMHTQIKHQTISFAKGFYSILSRDFLSLFSVPELQLLISGEDEPLNFDQLRQHTQYYGGFHDSHKVIVWLWDILKNDFSEEERALFLKFVTSSSKPPVLGFAFLNPPFSIRCVEVGEDEDSGDSVGSVIRGFFTIRRKGPEHRLPTSSTCFNLLKLPNYSRKNVLRDKLKYAITANSGFELS